ncbi:MAG TPA: hypothetical protein VFQ54_11025 [Thermomicrobiales bacterium]|nr:hypothetical protein [Thermomicrobiales bacterium]
MILIRSLLTNDLRLMVPRDYRPRKYDVYVDRERGDWWTVVDADVREW